MEGMEYYRLPKYIFDFKKQYGEEAWEDLGGGGKTVELEQA